MPRPRAIDDDALLDRLAQVFAEAGYEGASLARLAGAAGLQKASLYHRFPGGKAQMADEVLARVEAWISDNVVDVLALPDPPAERLSQLAASFGDLYSGGTRSCLLNMLAGLSGRGGPFDDRVARAFGTLIAAFAAFAATQGVPPEDALARATRALMLVQGSLVLSRGLGRTQPFEAALARLPLELGVPA
jgi:TetR/AcrR family transcriptional repressor of lmrAB and yxaGH operons